MKLSLLKSKVIESGTAADLQTAINTFFAESAERTYITILAPFNSRTDPDDGKYSVIVIYTE